jgi:hypothetical protein
MSTSSNPQPDPTIDDETAPPEVDTGAGAGERAFSSRRTHSGGQGTDAAGPFLASRRNRQDSQWRARLDRIGHMSLAPGFDASPVFMEEVFVEALLVAAGEDPHCFWNIVSWMFSSECEMPVIRAKGKGRGNPAHLRSKRETHAAGTGLEDLSHHRRRLLQDFVLGLLSIAWYEPGSDDEVVISTNGDFARAGLPAELPKTIYFALSDIARFGRYVGNRCYLLSAIEAVKTDAANAEKAAEQRRHQELYEELLRETRSLTTRRAAAVMNAHGIDVSHTTIARHRRQRFGL